MNCDCSPEEFKKTDHLPNCAYVDMYEFIYDEENQSNNWIALGEDNG